MSLIAQIVGRAPQASIVNALPVARLSVSNPTARLAPLLPASVVSGTTVSELGSQAALIPAGGITLVGAVFAQEDFLLTLEQIAAAALQLAQTPADPSKIELMVYGGTEQRANVDFVVTGQTLSWRGLALELLLDVGSAISVRYVSA